MIKEFTVGAHRVVNLGNYSSARVEASLTIVVAEGDDYESLKKQALDTLRKQMEDTYRTVMRKDPQEVV